MINQVILDKALESNRLKRHFLTLNVKDHGMEFMMEAQVAFGNSLHELYALELHTHCLGSYILLADALLDEDYRYAESIKKDIIEFYKNQKDQPLGQSN